MTTMTCIRDSFDECLAELRSIQVPMIVRCRVIDANKVQCTAEAVDPDGELIICAAHLADALRMVWRRTA